MRNSRTYPFFCLLLAAGLFIGSTAPDPGRGDGLSAALTGVEQQFREDLAAFRRSVADYRAGVAAGVSRPELHRLHAAARSSFKRCEYLLEYLEPQTVKRYLNGAPLPKTEPKVPEVVVIEPMGLQVLDELVAGADPDYNELAEQLGKLDNQLADVTTYFGSLSLQHRHVFEAGREEVVRIFTLGLTGFDTPGTQAAVPEAAVAWSAVHRAYSGYSAAVAGADSTLDERIRSAFSVGTRHLRSGATFNDFDRMAFFREAADPLIAALPRAQELLEIESAGDDPRLVQPVNAGAASLFAADFLNADFYARLETGVADERRRVLGELLFFDPIMSQDLNLSCASCHRPELAFTDGKRLSFVRNAPTLVNAVYAEKYFYDLREEYLDRQVKHVVFDAHEFASDFVTIEERLAESDDYRKLFDEAYGDQPDYALSGWSISDALAHYVGSLRAADSPFDRYARGETDEIDPAARRGFNLFMGKAVCGTCHFAPTFSGLVPPFYTESESEVLGIPATVAWEDAVLDGDPGRIANGLPRDEADFQAFSFKTPTVRNVAVTAPYMHNGVYDSLEQVVDFYNRGGGKGIGIQLEHQTLPFDSLGLNADEIVDLAAFMRALTDYEALAHRPDSLPAFRQRPEWNDRYSGR